MQERPTKKQKELLSFIDGFIKGNGYGPSYREIMRGLDYKSVSTVATHVDGLITRGWLVKKDNSARSLEVLYTEQSATEKELRAKVRELRMAEGDHKADIAAVETTLQLLGYDKSSNTLVV